MPAPETVGSIDTEIAGSLPVVYMPGISHVIVDTDKLNVSKDLVVEALISNPGSFTKEDAFGIMFYKKENCSIEPFVYVKTAGTRVWERGCASGSASLAVYLAHNSNKSVKIDIAQPGGVMTVEAKVTDGKVTDISVEGKVVIAAQGKAYLPNALP
jgi:diaminopimelate epimerase